MAINVSNVSATSSSLYLKAWDIHEVVLDDISCDFDVKSKEGKDNHVLDIKMSNDSGSFTIRLFCPVGKEECKEGCARKRLNDNEFDSPSDEEVFVHNARHIASAFGADVLERVDKFYLKHDPTASKEEFITFCNGYKKLLSETAKEKSLEFNLKLIGNKEGYPRIPNILGITKKDSSIYIKDNYISRIGDVALSFSAKQIELKARYEANAESGKTRMADDDSFGSSANNNGGGAKSMNFDVDDI